MSPSIDHKERAHSHVGASSASRWWYCPGSVRLTKDLPDVSSPFAEEGTRAHELADYCLQTGVTDMMSTDAREHEHWTEEMAEHLQIYLDTVWGYRTPGSILEVERRFHLSMIDEGAFGTNDAMVYIPETGVLTIIDLKYGAGVPVEVENNKQLLYYALGAATSKHNYPLTKVEMVIVQPRCPHPDGPVRKWSIDAGDLLEWAGDLKEAIDRTKEPDAPLVPGSHCRWCKAAGFCEKFAEESMAAAKMDFDEPSEMSPTELADTLEKASHIESWIKSVRAYAYDQAMKGEPPKGFKLVKKRPTRKWIDESGAIKFMRARGFDSNDIMHHKFKSPAQIEKLVAKDDREALADYQEKESSGLTLVSVHDRRAAVTPNAADDFAD